VRPVGGTPSADFVLAQGFQFPEGWLRTATRNDSGTDAGITKGQLEAIEEAMRIIIEDDRERGVDPAARFTCARCARLRPLLGSIEYDSIRLCNACATLFEVARLNGKARTCAAFLGNTPENAN